MGLICEGIVRAALAKKCQCEVEDVNVTTGWCGSFVKWHPKLQRVFSEWLIERRFDDNIKQDFIGFYW